VLPISKLVGWVVGASEPTIFFVSCEKEPPPTWEYIALQSKERIGQEEKEVLVIAQVVRPVSESLILRETTLPEVIKKSSELKIDANVAYAKVRVIGYFDPDSRTVRMPRRAPTPGTPVYLAPDEELEKIYSTEELKKIHLGHLVARPSVSVDIDVNGFRRHLAILAATGAGKSYAAGLLMEQIIEKGGNVLVIDPHADYVFLGMTDSEDKVEKLPFADRVTVLKNPGSTGRYESLLQGKRVEDYTVAFSELDFEQLCELSGIRSEWTNIRDALSDVLKEFGDYSYTLEDVIKKLEELANSGKDPARSALSRLKRLRGLRLFGPSTTDVIKYLREPGKAVVVDLSGSTDYEIDVATSMIVSSVFKGRKNGVLPYPIFLFIEEAHRVVPKGKGTLSSEHIKRIAREGRKFGVLLTVISQRPSTVDPDVLSMCQSMIVLRTVNPVDQQAIRQAAEKMSEDLLKDLPGLNIGEAVVVGEVVKAPAIVKVSGRKSKEGGADIDLAEELSRARKELGSLIEDVEKSARRPVRKEWEL